MNLRRAVVAVLLLSAACASPPTPAPSPEPARSRFDADAEFLQKRDSAAERDYERLLQAAAPEEKGPLWVQIGRCRLGKGDAAGALTAFDEALTAGVPDSVRVEVWYRRGLAHNYLWRPDRALMEFRRVQDAPAPLRESAIKTDEFLYRLGVTCLRLGMTAEGRKWLDRIVKDHPDSNDASEARERLALKAMHIQIARVPNEVTAKRRVSEAKARGLTAEVIASASSPTERLVIVGRFTKFEDAVRELEKLRGLGYSDAFPIP